ncbi:hypothetical protein Li1_2013 [Lactococcus lactis subsp. lactis]|nr:hypothetical protein LKF24_1148 [Lactococcus lactis subsp. lactis]KSU04763.1 hypothetical protein Li1_2013 [Lactococcus lactis subsp. lactis]
MLPFLLHSRAIQLLMTLYRPFYDSVSKNLLTESFYLQYYCSIL